MRRRTPYGAAPVRTYGERTDSGRNCRRPPACRAARRFAWRVRVKGWTKDEVTGVALNRKLGNVCLAEKHHASRTKKRNRRFVPIGDKVDEQKAAPRRWETFDVEIILDAHGDTVEVR